MRTGENLQDLGLGIEFLDTTRSIINKRKIDKLDAMKSWYFYSVKGTDSRIDKTQIIRKYLQNSYLMKNLYLIDTMNP